MARRRQSQQQSPWVGQDRNASLDSLFSRMTETASQELGRADIIVGSEVERLLVGLYLPALCLRFLLQSTILPLGRIIHITGEEGSCKTAFLVELMRWHMKHGGGGAYIENEHKDSPELRNSILEWNPMWLARLQWGESHYLEEWMDLLSCFVNVAKSFQDAEDGPGHTVPILFGVDSIMATAPRQTLDKIDKEGHPSLGYPVAARLIADYMRAMPDLIREYPFTIVGTNHLKPTTDFMGRTSYVSPGGKSVKFMETYEIEMHKAPSGDIDTLEFGGIRVKFVGRKNGLGPSRKQIVAEMLWWHQEFDDGVIRQRTGWDWDTASVELLLSFGDDKRGTQFKTKNKKTIYHALMDIVPIKVTNSSKRQGYCEALGIPKDNPVHFRQIGAELERRQDLLEQIYPLLGIQPRRLFQPGVDYRDLMAQEIDTRTEEAAALYEHADEMPQPDAEMLDPLQLAVPPSESDYNPEDNDGVAGSEPGGSGEEVGEPA